MPSENHPDKVVALLELEERLLADEDGSFRKVLAEKLRQMEADTRARLRAMTTPDEYARLRKLEAGIEAAVKVLEQCCRPAARG